jgi:fatty-acyl-CoA synthase
MESTGSPYWPRELPRHIELPRTSVHYNLEVSAHRYPGKPLCIFYDSPLTYGQAWLEVLELAGFLRARCGVKRGDRVLLFMQNSPQFILGYYAILRADAMVVPVNPMNLSDELRHYVQDADATTAIVGQELFAQVQPLMGAGGLEHVIVAAYSDYLTQPTDLKVPEHCSAPRSPGQASRSGATHWAPGSPRAPPRPARRICASCPTPRAPQACPRAASTPTAR